MMHAPATSFRPAPAAPVAIPAAVAVPPVTSAGYLQLRRKYAGLTIRQLAERITTDPSKLALAIDMLEMLERPGSFAHNPNTRRVLASVMPFDAAVYCQLKIDSAVEAHPRVCRGCGYTVWDAYSVEDHIRSWTSDTACSACTPATGADR